MLNITDRLRDIQYTASEIAIDCKNKKWKNENIKQVEDLDYIQKNMERIRIQILQILKVIK